MISCVEELQSKSCDSSALPDKAGQTTNIQRPLAITRIYLLSGPLISAEKTGVISKKQLKQMQRLRSMCLQKMPSNHKRRKGLRILTEIR